MEVPVIETERIVEKLIPYIAEPDSALFDAMLACDSLNRVYVRELSEVKTKNMATAYHLSENRLVYKTIVQRDTIYIPQRETEHRIEVPVRVEIEKKVNELTGWQHFQLWVGRITGCLLGIILIFKLLKRK